MAGGPFEQIIGILIPCLSCRKREAAWLCRFFLLRFGRAGGPSQNGQMSGTSNTVRMRAMRLRGSPTFTKSAKR